MSIHWYCPSCRAHLPNGEGTLECPACQANFGPLAAWSPVKNNKGEWVPRNQAEIDEQAKRSIIHGVFVLIGRLIVVAIAIVVLFVLALLSSIPYGGGGGGFIAIAWLVLIAGSVWSVLPLLEAIFLKLSPMQRDP